MGKHPRYENYKAREEPVKAPRQKPSRPDPGAEQTCVPGDMLSTRGQPGERWLVTAVSFDIVTLVGGDQRIKSTWRGGFSYDLAWKHDDPGSSEEETLC